MKIKSIKLTNFRQFKGEQPKIEFSEDSNKNVTVIIGNNTSGKTTFIRAFKWCLYEINDFDDNEILNMDVKAMLGNGADATFSVEIELDSNNTSYYIKRSQTVRCVNFNGGTRSDASKLTIFIKNDSGASTEVPLSEHRNTINKILPKDLSDYFFLTGEHIKKMHTKGKIVPAIESLMKLDIYAAVKRQFDPAKANTVLTKLKNEQDIGEDQKSQRLLYQKGEAQKQLAGFNDKKIEIQDNIDYYERKKKELEEKLREHSSTKEKQKRRDGLQKDLQVLKSKSPRYEKSLVESFSKGAFKFFATALYSEAKNIIAGAEQTGEGIPDMHSNALEYILNRGKCICGADLTKNEGAREHIKYEQKLLPPENIGTRLRQYVSSCNQYSADTEGYVERVIEAYKNIRENLNEIEEKETAYEELSKELIGAVDIVKVQEDANAAEAEWKKYIERSRENAAGIAKYLGDIERIDRELDGLAANTEKNRKIRKAIAYAERIYANALTKYAERENLVKEGLNSSITKLFEQMYHGERIVKIDSNYKINLYTSYSVNGSLKPDTSPGLDIVKNFTFIVGIIDLAKKMAEEEKDNDAKLGVEAYPMVMDAPFSEADEIHISNIGKTIPSIAEQIVLVVMKKDWDCASVSMNDHVNIIYEIDKESETSSTIRRVM